MEYFLLDLPQLIVYGIVLGSILALGAIGVSLIFRILNFAHFAHGDLMTLGAYLALLLRAGGGLPLWLAGVLALAATALAAVAVDRGIYRRLRRTSPLILLIASVGVALVVRHAVQVGWGADAQVYQPGVQLPMEILGVRIRLNQIYILVTATALAAGLHLFLRKTTAGKALRAMADNMDLAGISGIDTEKMVAWAWVLAGALAAAAGVMLGIDTQLRPIMGWNLLLPVFAAAIVGGVGNVYGAIAGGMLIGIISEVSTSFFSPNYKFATAFAVMVAVLVIRPTGLFGHRR